MIAIGPSGVSRTELDDEQMQSATERLLESSWAQRERRASRRELAVDATAAVLFAAAAGALALAGDTTGLRPGLAALLIAVYAVVARIEFPVGAGYVVPTQLILVPMLLMLPPAFVPVAVGIGLVLAATIDWSLGRVPPRRVLSAVPDAWHAIGPALVLVLAGSPFIDFDRLPLLAAAFAAGCIVDLACSLVRMRLAGVVPELHLQMKVIAVVWAVDACLAPLGFLAAIATRQNDIAIVFVLPLAFLLSLLARDRSHRINQAHRRLKLVEQERARLQTAVRRLGDAFAAKLELNRLLEILLRGSVEALDAAAGRLTLGDEPAALELEAGAERWLDVLGRVAPKHDVTDDAAQITAAGGWILGMPIRISASPREVTGVLWFARADRTFGDDEIALIAELIGKVELSAAEIITHHTIREQALTDPLTGLGNRRKLGAELESAFAADGQSLLLLFDLDGFKDYNDTFGHLAGDQLLSRLGAKLRRAVEGRGRAYRLGGDEFCAHLDLDGQDAEEMILGVAAALTESGTDYTIGASVGAVVLPREAATPELALRLADERMYANKRRRSTAARAQAGEVLLRTMRAKQPELDEHSNNVAELATKVACRLGVVGDALEEISRAAQLHDIGKVAIPDKILNKPTSLNHSDWQCIHNHTILGESILDGAPALRGVARLVRASHERWDGSGYPDNLRGEDIPLGARIVSVCDAYEAMTSQRPYREAIAHETACQELLRCAGKQFDPAVVSAFLNVAQTGDDEPELDSAQGAAAHVRNFLDVAAD
ncbi:MAG: bifunctional diguanylate cyclase/phosphohydrolase [Solirubrobacteraceae bacterium]